MAYERLIAEWLAHGRQLPSRENNLIPPSVYHGLEAVTGLRRGRSGAKESEPIRPVPEDHIKVVLPHVPPQIAAMIRLQLLTGARPGEILIMRSCDIDAGGRVWVYRPARHKTEHHGKSREVFLGPQAQSVLRPWLRSDLQASLFSPAKAEADRNAERRRNRKSPMTPSQARRCPKPNRKRPPRDRYDMASFRRAIQRACKKAGVPLWSPHRLRHNAATRLRREHGIELARIILGHSSAFTTEIYTEADRQQAIEVMAKIG